jgi:hypothetical protein
MASGATVKSTKATGRRRSSRARTLWSLLGLPLLILVILVPVSIAAPPNELDPAMLAIMVIPAVPIAYVLVVGIAILVILLFSVITAPLERARMRNRMKRLIGSDRDGIALQLFHDRQVKDALTRLGGSSKALHRYLITHIGADGITIMDHRDDVARFSPDTVSRFSVGVPAGGKDLHLIAHIRAGDDDCALPIAGMQFRGRGGAEHHDRRREEVRQAAEAAIRGRPIQLS